MSSLEVMSAGPLTLIQDLGRPGSAHVGVPHSGALDPASLALANRLVGNDEGAAGLEVLVGGLRCRCDGSTTVALTGGLRLSVDGRTRPWGEAVGVSAGSVVCVEPVAGDLRGWLAFAGGLDVLRTLGSASTDRLSGLGPSPLVDGDVVALGADRNRPGLGSAIPHRRCGVVELPLHVGPRRNWITDESWHVLTSQNYVVAAASDRVGVRLQGLALERTAETQRCELASEGIVLGAVQVPMSGQPLVFLADHPTTGGYPVVAVVDPSALGRCAQLAPGDTVRFVSAY